MLEYFFVDLETTANGGPGDGTSPEAQWDTNRVLLCGWASSSTPRVEVHETVDSLISAMGACVMRGVTPVLVAHNAKFDIKHLMRADKKALIWGDVKVWDTMTWEYLNSGHTEKFISLEETAAKYGLSFKKELDLGALIAAGTKMEDIPIKDLTSYLVEDVKILHEVWKCQAGINPLAVFHPMQHLLPLAEMELNGLRVDIDALDKLYIERHHVIMANEQHMMKHITECCQWQDGSAIDMAEDFTSEVGLKSKEINMFARRTLSFLLTGVPDQLDITNKWSVHFQAPFVPTYGWDKRNHPKYFKGKTHLGYEIDERVLDLDPSFITQWATGHRKAEKIVSTYLGPMAEAAKIQGTVHPKLNTALTATGRLSSSQPNGQNMPPLVRELIKAGEGTFLYEIDYKQLEMVAVACISGCKDMQDALNNGDDLHYLSGKTVMGWTQESDMTTETRRLVKSINFGVLYGGKAAGLSYQTGVDRKMVQRLIDGFYKRFPGVGPWQRATFEDIVDGMYTYDIKEGEQRYASTWRLPLTGRKFTFVEQLSPGWLRKKTHRKWSFSPTQTSNYPIQGCAGGDLVMHGLYWLWLNKSNYKFLLTVHDSILIETSDSLVSVQAAVLDMCAATTAHYNLPVALACEVEQGVHWK